MTPLQSHSPNTTPAQVASKTPSSQPARTRDSFQRSETDPMISQMQKLKVMAQQHPAAATSKLDPEAAKRLEGLPADFRKNFEEITTEQPDLARKIQAKINGTTEIGSLVKITVKNREALVEGKIAFTNTYSEAKKSVAGQTDLKDGERKLYLKLLDQAEAMNPQQREKAFQALDLQMAKTPAPKK